MALAGLSSNAVEAGGFNRREKVHPGFCRPAVPNGDMHYDTAGGTLWSQRIRSYRVSSVASDIVRPLVLG